MRIGERGETKKNMRKIRRCAKGKKDDFSVTLSHTHTHACTHTHMHTCMQKHTHTCMHTHTHMHAHTHTHTHACTHTHTYIHIYAHSIIFSPDTRVLKRVCWQWHCAVNGLVRK